MNKHWNSSAIELKGVKLKDHTDSKVAWQAKTVLGVNEECLENGKYPNGKVLNTKDKEDLNEEIQSCKNILINCGLLETQYKLL